MGIYNCRGINLEFSWGILSCYQRDARDIVVICIFLLHILRIRRHSRYVCYIEIWRRWVVLDIAGWLRLLWWLGPWCDQKRAPKNIEHHDSMLSGSRECTLRIYTHTTRMSPHAAILVLPGLHPDGLSDARMDRFCRVLADAGMVVGAPELPSMVDSVMQEHVLQDGEIALQGFQRALQERYGAAQNVAIGIFCISASSIVGLYLASLPANKDIIHSVHLFGGFIDWLEALRFSMTGVIHGQTVVRVDPLSLPVMYMNIVHSFPSFCEGTEDDRIALQQGWFQFVSAVWEKASMQDPSVYTPIAEQIAQHILEKTQAEPIRELFLQGCTVRAKGVERALEFLENIEKENQSYLSWLDPLLLVENMKATLYISHGMEDVVVPYTQAKRLCALVKQTHRYPEKVSEFTTGLYHHTGTVDFVQIFRIISAIPKEIWTSIQMVRAIAKTGGILQE